MYSKLIILISLTTVYTLNDKQQIYLIEMLNILDKFTIILHFDTPSANAGNYILKTISHNKITSITTYDTTNKHYSTQTRPTGIKFVHFVLLEDPNNFSNFTITDGNVNLYHTVIFVVQYVETFKTDFLKMKNLNFAGRVIIVNMTKPEEVIVYKKCSYCGIYENALREIDRQLLNLGEISTKLTLKPLKPNTYMELHGHHLMVAHFDIFPHLYCRGTYTKSHCNDLAGSELKLLNAVAEKMNFSYSTVGDENEVFDFVLNGTADIVIGGVLVNYKRFALVTFTKFIRIEDFNFLYVCRISIWYYLQLYLRPFKHFVWLSIFGTLISLSLVFQRSVRRKNVSFISSFLMCLQLLIEQTNTKISSRLLGRYFSPFILLTLLFITCIVLSTSYKSTLSSILTRPPHVEPRNGDELIAHDYRIVYDKQYKTKLFNEIFSDTDPFLDEYIRRLGIPQSGICNQLQYIINGNNAILEEKTVILYKALYKCVDVVYPHHAVDGYNPDKLRITFEPIRAAPHAWALKPATPFWKAIDIMIGYLQNGGFLDKWTQDALFEIHGYAKIEYSKNNKIEPKASDFLIYGSSFVLYTIGNLFACIVFFLEVLANKNHQTT